MTWWRSRFTVGSRVPGRPWYLIFWWDACSLLCLVWMVVVYRIRLYGFEKVPRKGPVIFISNHQSYYDPILNGVAVTNRQFTAIAGQHLAAFKPFGWLMKSYGAVFVSASAGDKGPLRAALKELSSDRCVLIYPEESRCFDGMIGPFQRGMLLLLRKSKATVVPMAIEGAYDVWPRTRTLPKLSGRMVLVCGEPRSTEDVLQDGPETAVKQIRQELDTLRLEARAILRKNTRGRFPKPGPPDAASPS